MGFARLHERIQTLNQIGLNPESRGINRLALTPSEREATALAIAWMEEAGLAVRTDPCGNVFGRWDAGEGPAVWTGSHLDSVPEGGFYDGPLGVLGSLAAVESLMASGFEPERPIEVVSFLHEEGSRFGSGLTGSKIATGVLGREELDRRVDGDGVSLAQALRDSGLDPDRIGECVYTSEQVDSYLELHIEQGPVLEAADVPVGVVNHIAGPLFVTVRIEGTAAHAGACPMRYRRDPMVAAAEVIQRVEGIPQEFSTSAVATVGAVHAHPGARNVIPAWVEFSLDIRDVEVILRDRVENAIQEALQDVCDSRGLEYSWNEVGRTNPRGFSKRVIDACHDAAMEAEVASLLLPSGAAHDAMVMAGIVPSGMIFVRSRGGISHSPEEFSSEADIDAAVTVLAGALRTLSG
jgi:allantoate deiminase